MLRCFFWVLVTLLATSSMGQYEPLISSSWSMWSPWSFCSNNVMIRVRACSTVRGYKCVGHNKEFQSCNSPVPRRNFADYEDVEEADREMAMKQLYQDYEPEEVVPRRKPTNGNFHFISPSTPKTTTRQPNFPALEEMETVSTFDYDKYPKTNQDITIPTISTTTEDVTTTTTATMTTTMTTPMKIQMQKNETIEKNDEEVLSSFKGKYTLEEEMEVPMVSLPTMASTTLMSYGSPPGSEIEDVEMVTPSTVSIEESRERDFSTIPTLPTMPDERWKSIENHSNKGSFAIGKDPMFSTDFTDRNEEMEDRRKEGSFEIEKEPISPTLPTFSIKQSEENKDEKDEAEDVVARTKVELPTEIFKTEKLRTSQQMRPSRVSLITEQQKLQTFPKLMNEHEVTKRPAQKATIKPTQITMEISNKPLKKKLKKRRLRKLNRMLKSKKPLQNQKQKALTLTTTQHFPTPTQQSVELNSWSTDRNQRIYEETKELEARLLALKHRVDLNKQLLENLNPITTSMTMTPITTTTTMMTSSSSDSEDKLEGDTGRALSWLINDMERMIEDKARNETKKKEEEEEGFRIGEEMTPTETTTQGSPFPFPVEDGFSWIRTKRAATKNKIIWGQWSSWTTCQDGRQSRKRNCLKKIGGFGSSKYPYDYQKFIKIAKNDNIVDTDFGEPADYPMKRSRRSTKCSPPQIEHRDC